jgi:hypothetical protein
MADPITLFVTALATSAGRTAAGELSAALREVAGLQKAQLAILRELNSKVDALITGPFYTGQQQLADALTPGRAAEDREHLLKDARSSFTQALGQVRDPLHRSFAALHLAAVWLALGAPDDMHPRLADAHREVLRAGGLIIGPEPSGVLTRWLNPNPVVRVADVTCALMPYANALARTRRSWGIAPARAPRLGGNQGWLGSREHDLDSELLSDSVENVLLLYRKYPSDSLVQRFVAAHAERAAQLEGELSRGELIDVSLLGVWLQEGHDRDVF